MKDKEERFECFVDEWDEYNWYVKDNKINQEFEYLEDVTKILNKQDQRIAELEEQLKNAIVPKFKIGEYIYSVRKFANQILLAEGYITSITKLDDNSIHYHLTKEPHQFGVEEENCCRTMEESHERSQKLLKELQGE